MHSHYGLVCITHSDEVRYRTITRKRLLQCTVEEQRILLCKLYEENIRRLRAALAFCEKEGIALYRIPSSIFPFSDEEVGRDILNRFACDLGHLGADAIRNEIRLVMHPDQFVVLNSESANVVLNSIKILGMHAMIMDLLRQPRTSWALIEIHGGKSGRAAQLVECIGRLPDSIRLRLGLENDEYAYGADEIHAICMQSGVPMVFDAHHHVVKEKLSSYEDPSIEQMLLKARETWSDPAHQLVHISNGRTAFTDRQHSDFIDVLPSAYEYAPWIEIEAKSKELAIRKLRHGRSLPTA
ncbi:MAG: UV damage endonuclease UvsE [Burkholderiaceae bacterium]